MYDFSAFLPGKIDTIPLCIAALCPSLPSHPAWRHPLAPDAGLIARRQPRQTPLLYLRDGACAAWRCLSMDTLASGETLVKRVRDCQIRDHLDILRLYPKPRL
jgi:hypothetical protein